MEQSTFTVGYRKRMARRRRLMTPIGFKVKDTYVVHVELEWSEPIINVVSYKLFVNGVFNQQVSGLSCTVTDLTGGTAYQFDIVSIDSAGVTSIATGTGTTTLMFAGRPRR